MINENVENGGKDERIEAFAAETALFFFDEFSDGDFSLENLTREWAALAYVTMDRDLQIYMDFNEFDNLLRAAVGGIFRDKLMAWREGDEITREHRLLLAANYIMFTKELKGKRKNVYEKYLNLPDAEIAAILAVSIAMRDEMDAVGFRQQFPKIAIESTAPVVVNFLLSQPGVEQDWDDLLEN
jgi:hypothetical protein